MFCSEVVKVNINPITLRRDLFIKPQQSSSNTWSLSQRHRYKQTVSLNSPQKNICTRDPNPNQYRSRIGRNSGVKHRTNSTITGMYFRVFRVRSNNIVNVYVSNLRNRRMSSSIVVFSVQKSTLGPSVQLWFVLLVCNP
jgi:hypothetical protein